VRAEEVVISVEPETVVPDNLEAAEAPPAVATGR
jgi:hypothetical protein